MKVKRPSFSKDEKLQPWLSMLLDAYYIVDRGVSDAVASEQRKNRKIACMKGCSQCCRTHKDIPVYPLELVGISWYAVEKTRGSVREAVKRQLSRSSPDRGCPFLIETVCSIHPVRPISCRQFNVFGKPCSEGEDPFYTRPEDLLAPVKKHIDRAFFIMLPFYGIENQSERARIVESGSMHGMVRELHGCNWKSLAEKMESHDE